jgi:hypothetical protein
MGQRRQVHAETAEFWKAGEDAGVKQNRLFDFGFVLCGTIRYNPKTVPPGSRVVRGVRCELHRKYAII